MATIEIRDILDNETGKTIFPRTHVDAVIGLKDFSFFEEKTYPGDPTKKYVWLKDKYVGLGALGWISNGGIGSGSGSGGGGLITTVKGVADLGTPIVTESLTETFSAKAIESIFERVVALEHASSQIDLSDYGTSLSLTKTTDASYLKDANGGYIRDANGKRIIVGGQYSEVSHLNLLNEEGNVLSSVDLDIDLSSFATRSWVQQNFLTQETDPTVPDWAKTADKPSYSISEISGADDLKAIEAITGTRGLLKKTGDNVWELDTTQYLPLTGGELTGDLSLGQTNHIDIGPIRIEYDSTNKGLHITKKDPNDTANYGIYADGFNSTGGVGQN